MSPNPSRVGVALLATGTLAVMATAAAVRAGTVTPHPAVQTRTVAPRQQFRWPTAGIPTPVFAGGGSASSFLWRAWGDNFGVPIDQPAPPSKPNDEIFYAGTSEGSGIRYLLDQAFDNQQTPGNNPAYTDTTNGRNFTWPYPNSQQTPAPPDFVSGGSPLSNSTLAQYASLDQTKRGAAIVTQVAATGEALAFNLGPNSILGSRTFQLSRKTYCGIITGNIVDWSNSAVSNDNGGPVVSASTPIEVVYRTDSSGQSFILTEHIANVCGPTGFPYTGGVSTTFVPPSPNPPGATYVGVSGTSSELKEIVAPKSQPGAFGYLSPSYVKPFNPSGAPAAVLANKNGAYVALSVASVEAAITSGPYAKPPSGYPVVTNAYIPNPKGDLSYPIDGFIWVYTYTCYPNTNPDVTPMQSFFKAVLALAQGGPTAYDTIANNQGFAQLGTTAKGTSLRKLGKIKTINPSSNCT